MLFCHSLVIASVSWKTKVLWDLLSLFAPQYSLSYPCMTTEDLNIPRVHEAAICLLTGTMTPFMSKALLVLIVRDEELKMALEGLNGVRVKCGP